MNPTQNNQTERPPLSSFFPDSLIQGKPDDRPSLDSIFNNALNPAPQEQQQQVEQKPDYLAQEAKVANAIFPGKQVGQAIGTAAGAIGTKIGDLIHGTNNSKYYDLSAPKPLQVAGDIAQGALTVAAPGIGSEGNVGTKIASNALLGAGIGGTGAIAEGKNANDVANSTGEGALLGTAVTGAGETLSGLVKNIPSWFIKKALPKLESGNTDFALKNLDVGSVKSNLEKSNTAVKSSGKTIDAILSHPQYADETGNVGQVVKDTLNKYPNAQLNENKVASIVKNVAPTQKNLIDKVLDGTANLFEQNQLRQAIDRSIYPKFTDTPGLTFNKQVAKAFTDSLRSNVQGTAKETIPMFEQFSKEIDLRNALAAAKTKIEKGSAVSMYDILSGIGGGVPGVVAERAARAPAVGIAAAKGISAAGKAEPAIRAIGKAIKAPVLKNVTAGQEQ